MLILDYDRLLSLTHYPEGFKAINLIFRKSYTNACMGSHISIKFWSLLYKFPVLL